MKIKFEANQIHQIEAINSITSLFAGQNKLSYSNLGLVSDSYEALCPNPNLLSLSPVELKDNLIKIQEISGHKSEISLDEDTNNLISCPEFTVEMETGTFY